MWLTVFIFSCMVYCGCHYYYNCNDLDDNVIEESLEEDVKEETGVCIDLTPESVEK